MSREKRHKSEKKINTVPGSKGATKRTWSRNSARGSKIFARFECDGANCAGEFAAIRAASIDLCRRPSLMTSTVKSRETVSLVARLRSEPGKVNGAYHSIENL